MIVDSLHFMLVEGLYFRSRNEWRAIPISKSAIFTDKRLTLIEKRELMKFITFCLPPSEFGHQTDTSKTAEKVAAYADRPFSELLADLRYGPDLRGAFEYAVAFSPRPLLSRDAVPRIQNLCKSIGRYSGHPTPILANHYGGADLPQVFNRYAAVWGAPFVLGHSPDSILQNGDVLDLEIPDIGTVSTKYLIAEPTVLPHDGIRFLCQREIAVTNAPLFSEGRSIATIAPNVMDNEHPIWVIQFDSGLAVCQAGYFVVHFLSMGEVRAVADRLLSEIGDDAIVLRVAFALREAAALPEQLPGVIPVPSPSLEDVVVGTDFFINQAKRILEQVAPDADFFPPPTEEEVFVEEPPLPVQEVGLVEGRPQPQAEKDGLVEEPPLPVQEVGSVEEPV
jgi:hypothetical protein